MDPSNRYLLEDLPKRNAIIIVFFSVISLLLALNNLSIGLVVVTFAFSLYYSFKNNIISLAIIIVSGPFLGELTTGFFQLLVYMPYMFTSLINIITHKKVGKACAYLFWSILVVLISFLIGYESNPITFYLQIIAMMMLFCTYINLTSKDAPSLVFAFICCAIAVCFFVFLGGLENNLHAGRLSFGENIKKLSSICAVPLSFLIYSFIGKIRLFSNVKGFTAGVITIVISTILTAVLFMTLARGFFLALGIGVGMVLLFSQHKTYTYFLLVIVALLFVYIMQYIESFDLFRADRLSNIEEMSTGNGRIEIWTHYIRKISEMGPQYFFFGTGPGNIARISNIESYAHSTIFDYYFSYGIIGILTFIIIEYQLLKRLFRNECKIQFVIAVVFLFAYSTHGSAANMELFLLQSILIASIKTKRI